MSHKSASTSEPGDSHAPARHRPHTPQRTARMTNTDGLMVLLMLALIVATAAVLRLIA
jgi:hypothetical protein